MYSIKHHDIVCDRLDCCIHVVTLDLHMFEYVVYISM